MSSAKEFKNKYRQILDGIPCGVAMADRLVEEANVAFLLNMRVFQELDVMTGDATHVGPLSEALEAMQKPVEGGSDKCPFGFTTQGQKPALAASGPPKGVCPFPFILLHDPEQGMKHPMFSVLVAVVAVLTLAALARVADAL